MTTTTHVTVPGAPGEPPAGAPRHLRLALHAGVGRIVRAAVAGTFVVGALLVGAGSASAAVSRYASPSGSGTACTSADPCSLTQAVGGTGAGDEVIVAPGDYSLSQVVLSAVGVTVHGVAGKPRPRLLVAGNAFVALSGGATLRYVEVDQDPAGTAWPIHLNGGSLDQVVAKGAAQAGSWVVSAGWSANIRNSVIVAGGGGAILTSASDHLSTTTVRNVTAITDHGPAIYAGAAGSGGYADVYVRNVIARGGPVADDLEAWTDNGPATAKITVDHSNFKGTLHYGSNASVVFGAGNQTAAPAFVNAAGGDFRQAAGSPTIDAGFLPLFDGSFDVDGDPREIGTVDIGADEFVPAPTGSTGSADTITAHSARLTGSVDAKGAPTRYRFQYGRTTAYGQSTPLADAGQGGSVAAAATIAGLSPATSYHYRLVATNAGGTTKGVDRTFTTAAAPTTTPPPSTTPPPPAPRPFAGVTLVRTRVSLRHGAVVLPLRCPAGTVGRCSGRTKLVARRGSGSRRVRLGRARFSITGGATAKLRVHVSRAGRRLLAQRSHLRARDINAAHDGAGHVKRTVRAVRIAAALGA